MIPTDADRLGPNHWSSEIRDDRDQLIGYVLYHTNRDNPADICQSPIYLDVAPALAAGIPERHRWTVTNHSPLSLQPSIQCTRCGDQGWLRMGGWKPLVGAA